MDKYHKLESAVSDQIELNDEYSGLKDIETDKYEDDLTENVIWSIKMKFKEINKIHLLIIFGLAGIP